MERLTWHRCDRPNHFVASTPDAKAEIWWHPTGIEGPEGWVVRITCGQTISRHPADSKQGAADDANRLLPGVVAKERERIAKIEADAALRAEMQAAWKAGRNLDLASFDIPGSSYDRLIAINYILRERGWLEALKPLTEAVSAELYRRLLEEEARGR